MVCLKCSEKGFTLFYACLILLTRHPIVTVLVSCLRLVTALDDTVHKGSLMVASPSSMFGDAVVNSVYTMVFVLPKH